MHKVNICMYRSRQIKKQSKALCKNVLTIALRLRLQRLVVNFWPGARNKLDRVFVHG